MQVQVSSGPGAGTYAAATAVLRYTAPVPADAPEGAQAPWADIPLTAPVTVDVTGDPAPAGPGTGDGTSGTSGATS